jgi:YgiT-type zinc finger domain-containing protein
MRCVICKSGEFKPGMTMEAFTRGESVVVVKDIPALVCGQCGSPFLSDEVAGVIEKLINNAVRKGAEVKILRYAV